MRSLKPYFQLVRLPNLFTAAADSLAGYLLAGGRLEEAARWLPLCGASMAIYAGGIALILVVIPVTKTIFQGGKEIF